MERLTSCRSGFRKCQEGINESERRQSYPNHNPHDFAVYRLAQIEESLRLPP